MISLFLSYELKVAVLIAVFYTFWRLLVAKETWHRLNRIVLLSTTVASFILPLCVITIHQRVEAVPILPEIISQAVLPNSLTPQSPTDSAPMVAELEQAFDWQPLVFAIYIIGVAVVLSKTLYAVWRLHQMATASEIHPLEAGRQIAVTNEAKAPFSWWKTVFLNKKDYEEGTTAFLAHELGHIRLHHSLDVILVETLTALQWFNPTMWMLRADLRTIHEYEADQQVISHGFNDIQYLHLLIRKAAVQSGYSLANGFFNSTLKKRINMMMKPKTQRSPWLRFAYLLPIIAVSLALSAKVQKDVVQSSSPAIEQRYKGAFVDENSLIMLIADLDDLKKLSSEGGKTRKVKSQLDFNEHFTQESMDGKTIIVHLAKGTLYVNDKESKTIEADVNYAFPQGGFDWQINSEPFDETTIPALHYKTLKRVENHWNGKKNVVNLITDAAHRANTEAPRVLIGAYVRDAETKAYFNHAEVTIMDADSVELAKPIVREVTRGSQMYRYLWSVPRKDKYIIRATKGGFSTEYVNVALGKDEQQKLAGELFLHKK
jgi:hypothetical protein